jgi:hypothetical protein
MSPAEAGTLGGAGTITTFFGEDDGAPVGGPFPNSTVAQTSFLAAAANFGTVSTHGFGDQPVGFQTSYTFSNGDGTFTLNVFTNFGPGVSGISSFTFSNLDGFSIGGPNQNWLGFPEGVATFNLTNPTYSFGGFFTGLQSFFTAPPGSPAPKPLLITFNDGNSVVLQVPATVNGGAEYIGFTDTAAFTSFTISDLSNDGDHPAPRIHHGHATPRNAAGVMIAALLGAGDNRE